MKRSFWIIFFSVALSAIVSYIVVKTTDSGSGQVVVMNEDDDYIQPVNKNVNMSGEQTDFTFAAEKSVRAVVYVKVVKRVRNYQPSTLFEFFFGYGQSVPREQIGTGSGVIITEDGYIVTNNHVVEGASEIEVTMENNRTYKAKLVGADPVTDVALLKIEETGLPVIPYGDSDSLKLGEWVLAIGSPYGLTSTITAGIISAKGRSMISEKEFRIESFIQTDAAVNPGNSGGALVNTKGELVGINTAIISRTGSYAGYSFAIPVNMVKKVVNDFIDYGSVKRAYLGISMLNISEELIKQEKLSSSEGVYVADIAKGSAADLAGVRKGDILKAINSRKTNSGSVVSEIISSLRPGDEVELLVERKGQDLLLKAKLLSREEMESDIMTLKDRTIIFGAEVEKASAERLSQLGIQSGVEIVSIGSGKFKDAGLDEGYIITYINNRAVKSPEDMADVIKKSRRSVLIEAISPKGKLEYFGVGL